MKITKIKITNFKCYEETFTLALNDGLNVIVGANEFGKTTILEAIQLALTGLLHGRPLKNDVTSYLFNLAAQQNYVQSWARPRPSRRRRSLLSFSSPGPRASWPSWRATAIRRTPRPAV